MKQLVVNIPDGIRFYNGKQKGLGGKFENKVNIIVEKIKKCDSRVHSFLKLGGTPKTIKTIGK